MEMKRMERTERRSDSYNKQAIVLQNVIYIIYFIPKYHFAYLGVSPKYLQFRRALILGTVLFPPLSALLVTANGLKFLHTAGRFYWA
jgi:hypothetical protein